MLACKHSSMPVLSSQHPVTQPTAPLRTARTHRKWPSHTVVARASQDSEPPKSPGPSVGSADQQPKAPVEPKTQLQGVGDEVDAQMAGMWDSMKRDLRQGLDEETAKVVDSITYEELTSSDPTQYFRKIASAQLGPVLAAMGIDVDPYDFFVDLLKISMFIQFVTCGMVWFGSQSLGHASAGVAATATAGLALGYLTRPAFKVELLLYPVYNLVIQLFLPNATMEVPASSQQDMQGAVNRLGVALACAFLVPQFLWGWSSGDSATFVGPMCCGWFLFDLTFLTGLLLLVQQPSDRT